MQMQEGAYSQEDKELLEIEQLSQQLENLYKEMEQMRRENLLFESYIKRNDVNTGSEDMMRGRNKKRGKTVRQQLLTDEQKYDIATSESDALKKNIDQGKLQSDTILETLRAILDETDMSIQEIRKDAFDFHREILINGENARTGKIEAEKIIKYREDKLRQKDAQIKKFTDKIKTLEGQIVKTEQQIKKKEELGDDLKFIHFHKLQIENKKYVQEIDEKNQKLLSLKVATTSISAKLSSKKAQLQQQELQHKTQITELEKLANKLISLKKQKADSEKQKEKIQEKIREYKAQQEQVTGMVDVITYVDKKNEENELKKQIKNLTRKIHILNFKYKKAKKFLNNYTYENQDNMYGEEQQQMYDEQYAQ